MRKIKVMIASMFGAIALVFACVFGTRINAASATPGTYEFDFNSASSNTVSDLLGSDATATVSSQNFKSLSASGTGVVTNSTNTWTKGAKMNGSGYVEFETTGPWEATIIVGGITNDISVGVKKDGTEVTDAEKSGTPDSNKYLKLVLTGDDGTIQLFRKSSKEFALYEMKLVVSSKSFVDPVKITYDVGTGNTIEQASKTFEKGTVITVDNLDTPINANILKTFDKWQYGGADVVFPYTVTSDVTFTATYKDKVLKYDLSENVYATPGVLANEMQYAYDTIFTLTPGLNLKSDTNTYLPTESKSSKIINTGGSSFAADDKVRTINFKAPSDGVIYIWWWGSETTRELLIMSGDASSTNDSLASSTTPSDDITAKKSQIFTYAVTEGQTYKIGSKSAINIFKVEFIPKSVTPLQQEAEGVTTAGNETTFVRFIAIVSGVDDINSSDFTFKIYRTNGDTTQSITRTVGTYKALTVKGVVYSATLPGEATAHSFNGNYNTEFYAVYVLELTNATYLGYNVYAEFTYGGEKYTTSGYTFE